MSGQCTYQLDYSREYHGVCSGLTHKLLPPNLRKCVSGVASFPGSTAQRFLHFGKTPACVFPKCEKRWAVEPGNEAMSGAQDIGHMPHGGMHDISVLESDPFNSVLCTMHALSI